MLELFYSLTGGTWPDSYQDYWDILDAEKIWLVFFSFKQILESSKVIRFYSVAEKLRQNRVLMVEKVL